MANVAHEQSTSAAPPRPSQEQQQSPSPTPQSTAPRPIDTINEASVAAPSGVPRAMGPHGAPPGVQMAMMPNVAPYPEVGTVQHTRMERSRVQQPLIEKLTRQMLQQPLTTHLNLLREQPEHIYCPQARSIRLTKAEHKDSELTWIAALSICLICLPFLPCVGCIPLKGCCGGLLQGESSIFTTTTPVCLSTWSVQHADE
jgi:hypothetical protein